MKILIVGSKGFIGSHAVDFFSKNQEVWGADIVNGDETNYFTLEKLNTDFESIFEHNQFDACINASGNGSVPISINLPVFDFELNVLNTIKILDAIRKHNPACKYLNLSSAAVYGNPETLPIVENVDLKPLSPYGWHKLYAEQVCKEYFYMYNLQTINLRLFSVYGENLRKQLFWDIFQKSLRSTNIELFGTGMETRDFIYISDLLEAVNCVLKFGLFNGESVNIASGVETTIQRAATIFCKALNNKLTLNFNKIVKPGDPLNWKADISLVKSFGFEPNVSVEKGMNNIAKWLKESI